MAHVLPKYPADHPMGMRVPKGGSNCEKCEYVRNNDQDCANHYFQKWNGSEKLPLPADVYCCDMFEIGKPSIREKYWGRK